MGVIADTHGLLRPEALAALEHCERIIHAGDLGAPGVFEQLGRMAPTVAIRGNVDRGPWAATFPETLALTVGSRNIYVLHDLHTLAFDPAVNGIDAVISGHSHRPMIETKAGVLYLNPGSAGPRRFSLPVTVARLRIGVAGVEAELIDILRPSRVAS